MTDLTDDDRVLREKFKADRLSGPTLPVCWPRWAGAARTDQVCHTCRQRNWEPMDGLYFCRTCFPDRNAGALPSRVRT